MKSIANVDTKWISDLTQTDFGLSNNKHSLKIKKKQLETHLENINAHGQNRSRLNKNLRTSAIYHTQIFSLMSSQSREKLQFLDRADLSPEKNCCLYFIVHLY